LDRRIIELHFRPSVNMLLISRLHKYSFRKGSHIPFVRTKEDGACEERRSTGV
jgi:hypothetical protein